MSVDVNRGGSPRRATRYACLAVAAVSLAALGGCSDDGDDAVVQTTEADTVSDSDEVVTDLPQEASLAVVALEGRWYVENDGNVTMSEVVIESGSDTLCELGTLPPGERATCDEADGLDAVEASGTGPQGQSVTATSG